MATLIKRHSRPINKFTLIKNTFLPLNMVVKNNYTYSLLKTDENFILFRHQIRQLIEQFLATRTIEIEQALKKGFKRDKINFILALIRSFYQWHTSVDKETHALMTLAQKICQTIVNQASDRSRKEHYHAFVEQKLHSFFQMELHLSSHDFDEYYPLLTHGCQISPFLSLLTLTKHDKEAVLQVKLIQENFIISLSDVDIRFLWTKIMNIFSIAATSSINCTITPRSQYGIILDEERENP